MNDKPVPKFVNYYRDNFMGSIRVNRRLTWLQRHIYLRLCLEACWCATRPYLPDNDTELALLADVPDEVWAENKKLVLAMFTKSEEGYTHPRIISEWERIDSTYSRYSENGKKSGEARRAKAERGLNGGSTGDEQAVQRDVEQIKVNEIKVDEIKEKQSTSTRINDNDASRSTSQSKQPESGSAAAPSRDIDLTGLEGEAGKLVKLLHFLLSQRKDKVEIRSDYEKLWLQDFRAALKQYSFEEVKQAVLYSQLPRNQKYYKRAKPLIDNLVSLIDQCLTLAAIEEVRVLWALAEKGRLPAPKSEKAAASPATSVLDTMNGKGKPCRKCPDGVPNHLEGKCPPVDMSLIDVEDL